MKKIVILIISIILAASILAIAVFAITSLEQDDNVQLTTFEAIVADAKTENGIYSVAQLNQKEIFSDLSSENLENIFTAFDVIIDNNDTIEIANEAKMYINYNGYKNTSNGKCTIDTTADRDQIKLAMLVSVYFTNFPNAIASCHLDIDPNTRNVVGIPFVYISFDYAEYGFDNALDYLVSCREKTSEYGDKTYVLNAYDCDMFLCKDGYTIGTPAPNLLGFAREGLSKREEMFGCVSAEKNE